MPQIDKHMLALEIFDALKSDTLVYVGMRNRDLESVVIDGEFDLVAAAERILRNLGDAGLLTG